uniref:Uncharacterized protein n=1 Tax=Brassica campestris TaxID=3711 RepID=A0A3P6AFN9_BRACM|nr:unnamed protein product [Brassica rapa]
MTPPSSILMGKHHHMGLQLDKLLSDQAVHLVEGLELDKLNEKFLPIKDTHQVHLGWNFKMAETQLESFSQVTPSLFFSYAVIPFFCRESNPVIPPSGVRNRNITEEHTPFKSTSSTCDGSMNRDYTVLFPLVSQGVLVSSLRVQNYVLISSLRNRKVLICHSVLIRLIIWSSFGNFKKGQI